MLRVPTANQFLELGGVPLSDPKKKLDQYKISDESAIVMRLTNFPGRISLCLN